MFIKQYKYIYINNEKTKYIIFKDSTIINKNSGNIITPCKNVDGYLCVHLSHNGKLYNKRVHRLLAEAFIKNPKNKFEVHHIDRNRTNNDISNLMWCTRKEHFEIEKHDFGVFNRAKGEQQGSSKHSDEQIRLAALELANGIPIAKVAKKYNISKRTIYNVYNKKSWKHLTVDLNFPKLFKPDRHTYSEELKESILRLLKLEYGPKKICSLLDIEYTPTIKNYIKTMRARKINKKKGSTTIENEGMYIIDIKYLNE